MSKLLTTFFFTLSLLLLFFFFTSTEAARLTPANLPSSSAAIKAQLEAETEVTEVDDQSCQGLGKEDCLERRSLAAHLDYIYTQGSEHHKP